MSIFHAILLYKENHWLCQWFGKSFSDENLLLIKLEEV